MTTPSEILSRAADLIRDAAALAVAPPWSQSLRSVMHGRDEEWEVALTPTTTTARWITLMSPDKAEHIETWLRCAAEMCNEWDDPMTEAAIAFARSVLGVQEEVSDGS